MNFKGVIRYKSVGIIIILIGFITIISCSCSGNKPQKPSAIEGVLDLSEWDFSSNGILPLDGEWEIYWNKLLEPNELNPVEIEGIKEYVHVPGYWNKKMLGGEKVKGSGVATLRLKVKTGKEDDLLELRIMRIYTAYNIWINGVLEASEGKVGSAP